MYQRFQMVTERAASRVPPRVARYARIVTLGIIIGIGIGNLYWAIAQWTQADAGAYWDAAVRLRSGQPLYPLVTNVEASSVYRYAPWFAWATVPFTFLPVRLAGAIWSLVLVAASTLAVVPLARRGGWLPAILFWPILIGISASGNVQALIVVALVYGVERRSGPLWIGIAASLKIFPILFALVYAGRGEWLRAGLAAAVAAALWSPALLFDLRGYVTDAGQASLFFGTPVAYALVLAAMVVAALRLGRGRYAWLAAATAVVVAAPRLFVYDVTYAVVGVPAAPSKRVAQRASQDTRTDGAAFRPAPAIASPTSSDREGPRHPPG